MVEIWLSCQWGQLFCPCLMRRCLWSLAALETGEMGCSTRQSWLNFFLHVDHEVHPRKWGGKTWKHNGCLRVCRDFWIWEVSLIPFSPDHIRMAHTHTHTKARWKHNPHFAQKSKYLFFFRWAAGPQTGCCLWLVYGGAMQSGSLFWIASKKQSGRRDDWTSSHDLVKPIHVWYIYLKLVDFFYGKCR